MAELGKQPGNRSLLEAALGKMREALEMLDQGDAPKDIGAHLDLAIARLVGIVGREGNDN